MSHLIFQQGKSVIDPASFDDLLNPVGDFIGPLSLGPKLELFAVNAHALDRTLALGRRHAIRENFDFAPANERSIEGKATFTIDRSSATMKAPATVMANTAAGTRSSAFRCVMQPTIVVRVSSCNSDLVMS